MWLGILIAAGLVVLVVVLAYFGLLPWETAHTKEYTWDDY